VEFHRSLCPREGTPLIFNSMVKKNFFHVVRRILALDASVGQVSREIDSPHSRPVHYLALPSPSQNIALSAATYQTFASAATDGIVTLWDLRSARSVFVYSGHVNRSEPVQVAFSPCLQYLAVGSEDGAPRQVDIRIGRETAKLPQHRDVCAAVAYSPLHAQLVCGSYDGDVRFYSDSA